MTNLEKILRFFQQAPYDDIDFWLKIAQIVTGITSIIAIIISVYLLKNTVSNLKSDLLLNNRPLVMLCHKTETYLMELDYEAFGGTFSNYLPDHHMGVRHTEIYSFGKIKNYGRGPAVNIKINWIVESARTKAGRELINYDDSMRCSQRYELGEYHLSSNEESYLTIVPHFLLTHDDKELRSFEGVVLITYLDTIGHTYQAVQGFYAFLNEDDDKVKCNILFQEVSQLNREEAGTHNSVFGKETDPMARVINKYFFKKKRYY